MEMKFNIFEIDYKFSLENPEVFNDFYFKIFPELVNIENVTDLQLQKKGIDKILHFKNGTVITVDEKKRRIDYGDILIELRHEYSNNKMCDGWLFKCECDFIVYAIIPSNKIYLLPTKLLKKVWATNKNIWEKIYPKIIAKNLNYDTINIAIPTHVLLSAIEQESVAQSNVVSF